MFTRRALSTRPVARLAARARPVLNRPQIRHLSQEDIDDPDMNGGYINPPREKRQFRDPHADWWDKQERRNFGEPVHEDNDILGMFSPYEYTHASPGKAFLHLGVFVAAVLALCGAVSFIYPDKPSAPRTFEGGLAEELGSVKVRARMDGDVDGDHSKIGE